MLSNITLTSGLNSGEYYINKLQLNIKLVFLTVDG